MPLKICRGSNIRELGFCAFRNRKALLTSKTLQPANTPHMETIRRTLLNEWGYYKCEVNLIPIQDIFLSGRLLRPLLEISLWFGIPPKEKEDKIILD